MAIPQLTSNNTFEQWLTSTQLLIEHANYFEDTTNTVFDTANTVANLHSNVVVMHSNTVNNYISTLTIYTDIQNYVVTAYDTANNAYIAANNAWDTANLANVLGIPAYNHANGAFDHANAAFDQANNVVVPVVDDTTTDTTRYVAFLTETSGNVANVQVSSSKLQYNPSTGTLSSTSLNSLSDINLKNNIITIDNAIQTVQKLNGVSFEWKENNRKSYGVIAQEIEKILPELVEGVDTKTVNYSGLIAFLINAVKELDQRITNLENK